MIGTGIGNMNESADRNSFGKCVAKETVKSKGKVVEGQDEVGMNTRVDNNSFAVLRCDDVDDVEKFPSPGGHGNTPFSSDKVFKVRNYSLPLHCSWNNPNKCLSGESSNILRKTEELANCTINAA